MKKNRLAWLSIVISLAMFFSVLPAQNLFAEERKEPAAITAETEAVNTEAASTKAANADSVDSDAASAEAASTEAVDSDADVTNADAETADTEAASAEAADAEAAGAEATSEAAVNGETEEDLEIEEEQETSEAAIQGTTANNPLILEIGKPQVLNNWSGSCYLQFVPKTTGYYCFQSEGNGDPDAVLSEANGGIIAKDEDSGPGYNFLINDVLLTAGKTYKLYLLLYGKGNYPVTISVKSAGSYYQVSMEDFQKGLSTSSSGAFSRYCFIPTESGYYTFHSEGGNFINNDPDAKLYMDDVFIAENADADMSDPNFWMYKVYLEVGNEYHLDVEGQTDDPINVKIYGNFSYSVPKITKLENTKEGIKITFNNTYMEDSDMELCIYRRLSSSEKWEEVGSGPANSTTFIDTTALEGKDYYYSIRCAKKNAYDSTGHRVYLSDMDSTGKSIVIMPVMTPSLKNAAAGVSVNWTAVDGVNGYYIYRKTANTSYKKIATLYGADKNTYTDSDVVSGTTYTYAVKAYSKSGASTYVGKKITYMGAVTPKLTNIASGINVKWTEVKGASSYKIYRKTENGSYVAVKTTSNLSYNDTSVKSDNGVTYVYAIRAMKGSVTGAVIGKNILRLTHVTISATPKKGSMIVDWKKNAMSAGYQIQYGTSSTFAGAKLITVYGEYTVTKNLYYLYSGRTYYVRVRAVKTVGGVRYVSAWSKTASVNIL